ncbi:hypothetical protein ACHAXS_005762 [Conticribra weissflogii]
MRVRKGEGQRSLMKKYLRPRAIFLLFLLLSLWIRQAPSCPGKRKEVGREGSLMNFSSNEPMLRSLFRYLCRGDSSSASSPLS